MKKQSRIIVTLSLITSFSILGYVANNYQKNYNESIITKLNNLSSTSAQIIGCESPVLPLNRINVNDYGALGFDKIEDTESIQSAIDSVPSNSTIIIPPGLYYINAKSGIKLKSNITLIIEGTLQAIPNNLENSRIISINNSSNINIIGGTLIGERYDHHGTDGEWGMGIQIMSSSNILIKNTTSKDNWGDGFYIGRFNSSDIVPSNIRLCSIISTNNRRQGLSIVSGDTILVNNSVFSKTNGTDPQAGIDIETDEHDTVQNVAIFNSLFYDNIGAGIVVSKPEVNGFPVLNSQAVKNIIIKNNIITNNSCPTCNREGLLISSSSGNTIVNNIVSNNGQDGISLVNGSSNNIVKGNISTDNGSIANPRNGIGILIYYDGSINNTISENIVSGNTKSNILDMVGNNSIQNNIELNIEEKPSIIQKSKSLVKNLIKPRDRERIAG